MLDDVETITAYAEERSEFLATSELTESQAFIRSFVKEIAVAPGAATIRYAIPMPGNSPLRGGKAEEVALGGPVPSTDKSVGLQILYCERSAGRLRYNDRFARRTTPREPPRHPQPHVRGRRQPINSRGVMAAEAVTRSRISSHRHCAISTPLVHVPVHQRTGAASSGRRTAGDTAAFSTGTDPRSSAQRRVGGREYH